MAKLRSFLWFTVLSSSMSMAVLSSCTINESSDNDDGGEGGEDAGAGRGGTGGTNNGGSAGEGGASGEGSTDAPGGAGGAAGAGGAGEGGAAGNAGAGGAPSDNTCGNGMGGQGGAYSVAEGETCTDYCTSLFATCPDFTDDAAYATEAECLRFCQNFSDEQLCCRAARVISAEEATNPAADCQEAAGAGDECG